MVAGGRVGTICLRQPCVLCGKSFDIKNGEQVVELHDGGGHRAGEVCPACASSHREALKERLLARAERLREKAEELERWSGEMLALPQGGAREEAARRGGRRGESL
jgi:hypothetical protein